MDSLGEALALAEGNFVAPAAKDRLGIKIREFQKREEELCTQEKRNELEARFHENKKSVGENFWTIYFTHFDDVYNKICFELFSNEELLIITEFVFDKASNDQLKPFSDLKLYYHEKDIFEREMPEIIEDLYRSGCNLTWDGHRLNGFSFELLEKIARDHGDPSIRERFKERIGEFRKLEFKEVTLPGLGKKIKKDLDTVWRSQIGVRPEFLQELSDGELLEYVKTIVDSGHKKISLREFFFCRAFVENNIFGRGPFIEGLDKIRQYFPDEADFNRELIKVLRGKED